MNLSSALKQKNRLAGEIVRQQAILSRENSKRNDNPSKVDRQAVWDKVILLSKELGYLKGDIAKANIGIYPLLERMAEYKSLIAFYQSLDKRSGEEILLVGRDQEKLTYTWDSLITQEKCDALVAELQVIINKLQDEVDQFNAVTLLP